MPSHHGLEQRVQEATVARRLVLGAGGDAASYITKDLQFEENYQKLAKLKAEAKATQAYPIVAQQRRKVRRLQVVDDVHELSAEDGVQGSESAAWEQA